MRYRRSRLPAVPTTLTVATGLLGGLLAAPASPARAEVAPLPIAAFTVTDRPDWLTASDIAVNPPGVIPGTTEVPPVERGYVITGDQLDRFEITGTAVAVAELHALVERQQALNPGLPMLDISGYRVFVTPPINAVRDVEPLEVDTQPSMGELPFNPEDSPDDIVDDVAHAGPGTDVVTDQIEGTLGDVFILPVAVGVGEVAAAFDEGYIKVTTALQESPVGAPLTPVTNTLAGRAESDPQWSQYSRQCYHRKSNNTAWYDPCYSYATLAKDGDPNRTAWSHTQWGTAKSKSTWVLDRFMVKTRARETPNQRWLDWSPEADTDKGNCSTTTVGVNVNSAYMEHSTQQCDRWDISKENPDVEFSNWWRGSAWRKERNVAAMTSASLPNRQIPYDYSRYDYYARVP
jgi:hypothetical protein